MKPSIYVSPWEDYNNGALNLCVRINLGTNLFALCFDKNTKVNDVKNLLDRTLRIKYNVIEISEKRMKRIRSLL